MNLNIIKYMIILKFIVILFYKKITKTYMIKDILYLQNGINIEK